MTWEAHGNKGRDFFFSIWPIRGWAAHVLHCAPLPKGFRTGGWGAEDLSYRVQVGGSRGSCRWNTLQKFRPSMQTREIVWNRCILWVFTVFMQSSSETWGKTIRRRRHCRNCTKSMVEEPAVMEHFDPGFIMEDFTVWGLVVHFTSSLQRLFLLRFARYTGSRGLLLLETSRCKDARIGPRSPSATCSMHQYASCRPHVCHTAFFTMWCGAKTGGELFWRFFGGERRWKRKALLGASLTPLPPN